MKRPNWFEIIAISALALSVMTLYLETLKYNSDYDHLKDSIYSLHHDLNNFMDKKRC